MGGGPYAPTVTDEPALPPALRAARVTPADLTLLAGWRHSF